LKKITQFFSSDEPTLVTTHINPDGDALGSLLAVTQFLDQRQVPAFPIIDSNIPKRLQFLPGCDRVTILSASHNPKLYHRAIILDVGNLERIGGVRDWIAPNALIANIDHHVSNPAFGAVNILRPECSATTEILWDIAHELGLTITESLATNLYTGIATDTGRFSFSNTTARALTICAKLVELGAKPQMVAKKIYFDRSSHDLKHMGSLLANLQLYDHGRISGIHLHRINEVEDTDTVLDMALSIRNVEVAFMIAPIRGGKSKVSLRSKSFVDVRKIAESFGGGGHPKAAGFRFRIDPQDMQSQLLPVLTDALKHNNPQ
jgi:phosphoesterase RecJ-like protein